MLSPVLRLRYDVIRCLFFGICLAASQAENLRGQGTGLRLPADTVELRQQIRRLLDDPGGTKFAEAVVERST